MAVRKIVGQDEALQALVISIKCCLRPVCILPYAPRGGILRFLGPTFRETPCRSRAELLFGYSRGKSSGLADSSNAHFPRNCEWIGSPPDIWGTGERHPLITQEALAATDPRAPAPEFSALRRELRSYRRAMAAAVRMHGISDLTTGRTNRKVECQPTQ